MLNEVLPKRFVVHTYGMGVVAHGIEFPDGGVVVRTEKATLIYCDMEHAFNAWDLPWTMTVQYDEDLSSLKPGRQFSYMDAEDG